MDLKEYHLAITDAWKFLKENISDTPKTEEEWKEICDKARELGNKGPEQSFFRARLMCLCMEEMKNAAR